MPDLPSCRPLHRLGPPGSLATCGRLTRQKEGWWLANAHAKLELEFSSELESSPVDGALVRVTGRWNGDVLSIRALELLHEASGESTLIETDDPLSPGEALRARARMNRQIRELFDNRDFLEVETPHAVGAPGTDLYLKPVGTRSLTGQGSVSPYLHTSPEFAMKRLLTEGFERIYQLSKVWRDGEVTDWHHPEFTMLEWYRAWEGTGAVMEDVESVVGSVSGDEATVVEHTPDGLERNEIPLDPPFDRVTMRELVDEACGFDLFDALDYEGLWRVCDELDLLPGRFEVRHPRDGGRWDDLFFELVVTRLEPVLADKGAVFLTEWPAPLAILARKHPDDPRVAERFELYVGGVELANGFRELTDPDEQRRRFEREIEERRELGMPELPMPESFLEALEYGLPPSSGVALGVDRLLMLTLGASTIETILPLAARSSSP